ncbi:MAG: GNAT family N-acetyltransferase [Anaerolineales bacterium]|nr:GNAT family N-acetyltransferase [Chloroflexota bacterium]MBL6981922.1 GNAT family N-acetyltransferase [Anaerolineales bacterium]
MTAKKIIKDLGNGLILRHATGEDVDDLVTFNAKIHSEAGPNKPDEKVGAWVRDLITKPHPTTSINDFTVVEDTASGQIVSSMNVIPQTWNYAGIEFGVGRPELVGTDPEYRKRGLVRAQFKVIHQWCAERDLKVQAITGIPYYYRQFGYEMGLALDGGRVGYLPHIPKLKKDTEEPYKIRAAREEDAPFINELYHKNNKRYLVSSQIGDDLWHYELVEKGENNITRFELRVIETSAGEKVGFLAHPPFLWGPTLTVVMYEIVTGVSWLDVTPSVLRYLKVEGKSYAEKEKDQELEAFAMWMGTEHPVYEAIIDRLPRKRDPYAYYVRVADLPGFIRHISPVLEERLENSVVVGHTGELKLSFFRSGLKLIFEKGILKDVEAYAPEHSNDGDVLFPDLTFLRVLFGYNDFWEVEKMFADCYARNDHGRALMPILFPQMASNVRGVS